MHPQVLQPLQQVTVFKTNRTISFPTNQGFETGAVHCAAPHISEFYIQGPLIVWDWPENKEESQLKEPGRAFPENLGGRWSWEAVLQNERVGCRPLRSSAAMNPDCGMNPKWWSVMAFSVARSQHQYLWIMASKTPSLPNGVCFRVKLRALSPKQELWQLTQFAQLPPSHRVVDY
jgi:hypothetical protein